MSEDDSMHGYIRVTEVLSLMTDFSAIPAHILQGAADRGTAVHEAIAGIVALETLPSQWHGYVRAAREWERTQCFGYTWQEKRLYDKDLMITGQMDALLVSGELVDWKTSARWSPSWEIQMNAYMKMLQKNGHDVHKAVIVQLMKDGTYKATSVKEDPSKWHTFLCLLSIYKETHGPGISETGGEEDPEAQAHSLY